MKQLWPTRLPALERIAAFFFLACFILQLVGFFAHYGQLKGIIAIFGGVDQFQEITNAAWLIAVFFSVLYFIKWLRERHKREP